MSLEDIRNNIKESHKDITKLLKNLLTSLFNEIKLISAERDLYLAERNIYEKRWKDFMEKNSIVETNDIVYSKLPLLPASRSSSPIKERAEADNFSTHPSRLTEIDPSLCMARRIDEEHPLRGTRKEDIGSNGMVYPELQCKKKPVSGNNLCVSCEKKYVRAKQDPETFHRGWYGRLDEPMYYKACVVGCGHYFKKYPNGIPGDPATIKNTS